MCDAARWVRIRKLLCLLLCLALSPLPAWCAPQAATPAEQRAGEIGALRPAATRNDVVAQVKDDLHWNDLLKTDASGRLRANLADGSLLSLGSTSQLRVAQHDAATQQTSLELNYGRLRSRVVKLTQPGAKFEVTTPHAVCGVIGTDFYIFVDADRTLVIVYSGRVVVKRLQRNQQNPNQVTAVEPGTPVDPGQMLEVRSGPTPPGAAPEALRPEPTPPGVQQDSIRETAVEERQFPSGWSRTKKLLVFGGIV
ncbi:MAG TPA: FecR family protein, partial [Terriglobales bacterium]|nr:FecR family protein [Terriglobales bacterium]